MNDSDLPIYASKTVEDISAASVLNLTADDLEVIKQAWITYYTIDLVKLANGIIVGAVPAEKVPVNTPGRRDEFYFRISNDDVAIQVYQNTGPFNPGLNDFEIRVRVVVLVGPEQTTTAVRFYFLRNTGEVILDDSNIVSPRRVWVKWFTALLSQMQRFIDHEEARFEIERKARLLSELGFKAP